MYCLAHLIFANNSFKATISVNNNSQLISNNSYKSPCKKENNVCGGYHEVYWYNIMEIRIWDMQFSNLHYNDFLEK